MIYDIHTHHHPNNPGEAIVQFTPDTFAPQLGHLYSVGLHPWEIRADWRVQMARMLVIALHPQVAMIGEAGMDKKNGAAPLEQQIEVFREHVRLSELVRKPLIVHCVKAIDELLAIRKEMKATLPWVFHGFRGGVEQWKQLTRAGIYVSIGECHDRALLKEIPLTQLFLESDVTGDITTTYRLVSEGTGINSSTLVQHVATNIHTLLTAHLAE